MCSGIAMAQSQNTALIQETMQEHLTKELQRHGITEGRPSRPSKDMPMMGIKAPAPLVDKATTTLLCDSIVSYNTAEGPFTKQVNTYRADGRCTTRYIYAWRSNHWQQQDRYDLVYDENGNLASETYFFWFDSWATICKYEYTYDEKNRQTSYASYYSMGDKWIGEQKLEYTYDDNDYQTSYAVYNYDTEIHDWVGNYRNDYLYDEQGRTIYYAKYHWQDGGWICLLKTENAYNEQNQQTLYVEYKWQDGQWIGKYKSEVFFDELGNETSSVIYYWANGDWAIASKTESTYDYNGCPVDCVTYYSIEGALQPFNRTDYTYVEGLMAEMVGYVYENDEWMPTYRYEYNYDASGYLVLEFDYYYNRQKNDWQCNYKQEFLNDEQGRALRQVVYQWQGGQWIGLSWDENTYDSANRQTGYTHYNWIDGCWVGYSKYEYNFDDYGNQTRYIQYTWYNGEWKKSQINEDYYNDLGTIHTGSACYQIYGTYEGPMTFSVDIAGTELAYSIDYDGLVFTGEGFRISALYVDEPNKSQRRCIWQNDGSLDDTDYIYTYRFGCEGYEAACTATFNETDWDLIKRGHLTAQIETIEPHLAKIYLSTSNELASIGPISYGSYMLTGNDVEVMAGSQKHLQIYDEQGNLTNDNRYNWDWQNNDWKICAYDIYYYSIHEVEIEQIYSDLHPLLSKEIRNGQIRIVVGDKTYNLLGQEIVK